VTGNREHGTQAARRMLIQHLRRRPRDVAWLAAWSAVQAVPAVASGWSVAQAVSMFLADRTAAGLGWLGLLALAALAGAAGTRQTYLRLCAIVEPFRDELVTLIVGGALANSMDTTRPPDLSAVARMTHQAEIVRDAYAGMLSLTCTLVFTVGAAIAGLVTVLPAALPYAVPPLLATAVVLRLLLRPYAARQRASVTTEEAVAESAARAVSGIRDVTACGAEDIVLADIGAHVRRQADAARSAARAGVARQLCLAVGGWLPLLLVLAAAPSMLRHGASPARVIGAITYVGGSLRGALYTLGQGMGAGLVRLSVTLERIIEASSAPVSGGGRAAAPLPRATAAAGAARAGERERRAAGLRLRGVEFGYGERAEPVIRDLSIDIPPGDHLAIVGPSGIGKSSLAGLLAGMLIPVKGDILLGAVPMTRYPRAALPGWRVLLPQEAYVFTGTLAENIRYLHPAAARTELDVAADAVGLTPLVSRLGGYDAPVNPAALSAGERQLIALTRAYLSPAPIAILDEATCHLDPAAEEHAEAAFARREGTLIVIAHRITSALRARRILVLDGTRAHAGDHESLLAGSAMYRDLVGHWNESRRLEPSPRDHSGSRS
jgi:ABC-type multidrug transport system fused ATPase/permease subunit